MNNQPRFTREVREAKNEMEEAMRRLVIGTKNLTKAFQASMEKALPVYSKFQRSVQDYVVRSPIEESKERFRGVLEDFETNIADMSCKLEDELNSVQKTPELKRVVTILQELQEDPTSALDMLRGVPEEMRLDYRACRDVRMYAPEHFAEYLDDMKRSDLPKAKEKFGELPIPAEKPDEIPEDDSMLLYSQVYIESRQFGPRPTFRRKSM